MAETVHALIEKGRKALQSENTLVAMMHLEKAYSIDPLPAAKSLLSYCLAKERRQFQRALTLCREALHEDPANPEHYYNLGRIYLLARQKRQAIAAYRKGLKVKRYDPIIEELTRMGLRKDPVFSALPRDHFLNKSFGKLFARLGAR